MSTATVASPAATIGTRPLLVRRAAVLGAGTMGSRIAAHLANAGIPVLLLDLPSKPGTSDRPLAHAAINALLKSKPAAFLIHPPPRSSPPAPSTKIYPSWLVATGSSKLLPRTSKSKLRSSPVCFLMSARTRFSPPTPPACPLRKSPPRFRPFEAASSARIFSIRRATCVSLKSFPPRILTPPQSLHSPPSPICASASRLSCARHAQLHR